MRIWDLDPACLCRQHLLAEHGELHAIWSILTDAGKRGYSRHPETERWRGKLAALYNRHTRLQQEMMKRGYRHRTPLDRSLATGDERQDELITPLVEQVRILRGKGCECRLDD